MLAGCLSLLVLLTISVAIGNYFGEYIGAAFFWGLIFLGWIVTKFEKKKEHLETRGKSYPSSPALKSKKVEFKQATSKPPISPPSPSITSSPYLLNSENSEKKRKSSKIIEFTYTNAQGETSEREVKVDYVDDTYIEGYCYSAQGTRTFRLDRIDGMIWQNNECFFVDEWLGKQGIRKKQSSRIKPTKQKSHKLEICFTGFKRDEKLKLELLAEKNGFKVRTAVSKNLDFLVCGVNAGPSKIAQALERGIPYFSEDEFIAMLETGEIPQ